MLSNFFKILLSRHASIVLQTLLCRVVPVILLSSLLIVFPQIGVSVMHWTRIEHSTHPNSIGQLYPWMIAYLAVTFCSLFWFHLILPKYLQNWKSLYLTKSRINHHPTSIEKKSSRSIHTPDDTDIPHHRSGNPPPLFSILVSIFNSPLVPFSSYSIRYFPSRSTTNFVQ